MRKILVAVVTIGLLVGGVGVAWATTSSDATPTPAAATKPAARAGRAAALKKLALQVVAKTLHVTPQALVQELRSGKTIADVANEHHVAPQTVVNAIVDAGKQKVAALVQKGTLTPAQGAKIDDRLPQLATRLVNRHFGTHAGAAANQQTALAA